MPGTIRGVSSRSEGSVQNLKAVSAAATPMHRDPHHRVLPSLRINCFFTLR